jgi:hypothetical protein
MVTNRMIARLRIALDALLLKLLPISTATCFWPPGVQAQ